MLKTFTKITKLSPLLTFFVVLVHKTLVTTSQVSVASLDSFLTRPVPLEPGKLGLLEQKRPPGQLAPCRSLLRVPGPRDRRWARRPSRHVLPGTCLVRFLGEFPAQKTRLPDALCSHHSGIKGAERKNENDVS